MVFSVLMNSGLVLLLQPPAAATRPRPSASAAPPLRHPYKYFLSIYVEIYFFDRGGLVIKKSIYLFFKRRHRGATLKMIISALVLAIVPSPPTLIDRDVPLGDE